MAKQLNLRRAAWSDARLIWRWANEPLVRQSAFKGGYITWENHIEWFHKRQTDRNCYQYIAIDELNNAVGQIRFEVNSSVAEIDYSIDKNFRGQGLGALLLKEGIACFKNELDRPVTLQGSVKRENSASRRIFQKAGFHKAGQGAVLHKDELKNGCLIYQLKLYPGNRNDGRVKTESTI